VESAGKRSGAGGQQRGLRANRHRRHGATPTKLLQHCNCPQESSSEIVGEVLEQLGALEKILRVSVDLPEVPKPRSPQLGIENDEVSQ